MQWRSLKKSFNFVTFEFWNLRSRDSQDLWNLENCCKKIQVEIEILLLKLLRLNKSVKEIIYCWTNEWKFVRWNWILINIVEPREILPHLGTSPRSQIPRTDNCSRFVTGSIRVGEKKKKSLTNRGVWKRTSFQKVSGQWRGRGDRLSKLKVPLG